MSPRDEAARRGELSGLPAVVGMALLLMMPGPGHAQSVALAVDYETPLAGGPGGSVSELSCGWNRALVGIAGRAGTRIDQTQGLCREVLANGSWVGGETRTATRGGSGGSPFTLRCNPGEVLAGIGGRAVRRPIGTVVRIQIHCARLGSNGRISGAPQARGSAGGSGGSAFGPHRCADAKPGKALAVGSHTWVNLIGLACNYPRPLRVQTISPSFTSIDAGRDGRARVVFNRPVPTSQSVTLTSAVPGVVSVPSSVTVNSGASNAWFPIRGGIPEGARCVQVRAAHVGIRTNPHYVAVQPRTTTGAPLTLSLPVGVISQASGTVTLGQPAGRRGVVVYLGSSSRLVSVPSSVTVPAGQTSASFTVNVSGFAGCAVITAKTGQASSTRAIHPLILEG